MAEAYERILVALDVDSLDKARALVDQLAGHVGGFKIGKELFVAAGPAVIEAITQAGGRVFLDMKFHDIPHTVAGAVRAAVRHGVWMLNVHAGGGAAMCRAAVEAAQTASAKPLVIGVTVLTSLNDDDLNDIGLAGPADAAVVRLARLARANGLDGVVASAKEVRAIKQTCGDDFLVVTPGIRPAGSAVGDQKRVVTPAMAVADGADYLVIGRPITGVADPAAAADAIAEEIANAPEG